MQTADRTTTHYWGYRELTDEELLQAAGGDCGGDGDCGGGGGADSAGDSGGSPGDVAGLDGVLGQVCVAIGLCDPAAPPTGTNTIGVRG